MFIFSLVRATFWQSSRRFLILIKSHDAWTTYDRRAEVKEQRKRTRTTKQFTNDSSNLMEEVTPQILVLDTKPFVIFTDALFQVD